MSETVAVPASTASTASSAFLTPADQLAHWQGHRRLTRRVIEAFPADQLHSYAIGGMRTFGVMVMELVAIGVPMLEGILTGEWASYQEREPLEKEALLRLWDEQTARIDELWAQIPAARFAEHVVAFGQFPGPVYGQILYAVDNEIHHRAQGFVYLRALGVVPPAFYER